MNCFIICGDGKQYPIVLNESKNRRKISANIAEFSDFDGNFVNKRGNRGLEFPIEFVFIGKNYREQTQSFLESLKDTRPCMFYLPYAENGICAQVIGLEWSESFVNAVECTKFSLTLHETLSASDFEAEYDEFLEESEKSFAENVLGRHISNIVNRRQNRKFRLSNTKLSSFIGNKTNAYSRISMGALGVPAKILQEAETIKMSLTNSVRTIQTNFPTTMFLINSLMRMPLKFAQFSPFSARQTVDFYTSAVSDLTPPLNPNGEYDYTDFENSFYCLNCAISANAIKDYAASIDYETHLTRRELVQIQSRIYDFYSDFVRINETPAAPECRAVSAYLVSAMLHIDNIFSYGKIEKTFVCEFPTDMYKLVGELYPSASPEEFEKALNKFQRDNHLHADELFVLPKGRKVIYYD